VNRFIRFSRLPGGLIVAAGPALAAAESPGGDILHGGKGAAGSPLQIIILLTALALLPAVVMSVTPFLRITVVLHFLRQALGTQSTPSNQVLVGLSLFLSFLIMQPILNEVYTTAWRPYEQGTITSEQAIDAGGKPIKTFLIRFAREKDIRLMLELTHAPAPARPSDLGLAVLVPAYILSELKVGFQIGAVLYLPFGGHGAVAAGDDFGAFQDPALCSRGRLEPGDRIAHEEF